MNTGSVWHYTGNAGLQGILCGGSIWASSPQAMNDLSEIKYGEDFVRRFWKETRDSELREGVVGFIDEVIDYDFHGSLAPYVFIVSASADGDLLNQWAHYSGDSGYSLGLNTDSQITIDGGEQYWPRFVDETKIVPGWYPVQYSVEDQRDTTKVILEYISSKVAPEATGMMRLASLISARLFLRTIMAQFKHPAFAAEQEVRYIVPLPPGEKPKFRATPDRLVPYVELKPSALYRTGKKDNSRLLTGVKLGPNSRPGSEDIVRLMLDQHGHDTVEVTKSDIPYLASRG